MLKLVFWDVQHGSAAYIATPGGQHIALDLGTGKVGASNDQFSPLAHLYETGVRQLDGVIITHPHRDHLDDIDNFDLMNPRTLLRPTHLSESDIRGNNRSQDERIIDKYLDIHRRYNGYVEPFANPLLESSNGGVVFKTFVSETCPTSNLNNHSIVTVISYAGSKILISGDNEKESWSDLLRDGDFVSAIRGTDILVASHHGRRSGFSSELFDYIEPRLTLISDGPIGGTSITDLYKEHTQGLVVRHRSGSLEKRYCLTTRKDGVITVNFDSDAGGDRYILVGID